MNSLQILAQHRDALLLAEAIGWLHDYRKCSDEHLKVQAANPRVFSSVVSIAILLF